MSRYKLIVNLDRTKLSEGDGTTFDKDFNKMSEVTSYLSTLDKSRIEHAYVRDNNTAKTRSLHYDKGGIFLGCRLNLPHGEEGLLHNVLPILWGHSLVVKIKKGTLNAINSTMEYKPEDVTLGKLQPYYSRKRYNK